MTHILKIFTATLFLTFGLLSCSSSSDDTPTPENNLPEFTDSPIDLGNIKADFAKDIFYDNKSRTSFDIFLPESDTPTPLVIYIHGGGFTSGNKEYAYSIQKNGKWDFPSDIRSFLDNGIAFASIRYTLLDENDKEGVIKPLSDVKRALQYIRHRADDFNIDKTKIALGGNSAGAGTSLWIATSDDMSDPENDDPVLRESTRVLGIAIRQTQSTYDLERWPDDVFGDYGLTFEEMASTSTGKLAQFYGISNTSEYNTDEITEYRKQVDMLDHISPDDPEIWVENIFTEVVAPASTDILNHHAYHAKAIKEHAESAGVAVVAYYGKDPLLYADPSGETWTEFFLRKLGK
ncbi:hypothetical protein FUAX_51780 (plasmid) [Fulvitalea axinellae]|uniref:BD-FAE-like domain-containing protein n=1 Tax=Fulvitalea axinellae TaxID=1182444 RepID=A0AAU9DI19_9BACT|nr:hypothetical protein FUAX_51780 [Fulvitalea axinellae]